MWIEKILTQCRHSHHMAVADLKLQAVYRGPNMQSILILMFCYLALVFNLAWYKIWIYSVYIVERLKWKVLTNGSWNWLFFLTTGSREPAEPASSTPLIVCTYIEIIDFLNLGRERFTLVSHDWGAVITWEFVQVYGDMLECFVALSGPSSEVWSNIAFSEIWQFLHIWCVLNFDLFNSIAVDFDGIYS